MAGNPRLSCTLTDVILLHNLSSHHIFYSSHFWHTLARLINSSSDRRSGVVNSHNCTLSYVFSSMCGLVEGSFVSYYACYRPRLSTLLLPSSCWILDWAVSSSSLGLCLSSRQQSQSRFLYNIPLLMSHPEKLLVERSVAGLLCIRVLTSPVWKSPMPRGSKADTSFLLILFWAAF